MSVSLAPLGASKPINKVFVIIFMKTATIVKYRGNHVIVALGVASCTTHCALYFVGLFPEVAERQSSN